MFHSKKLKASVAEFIGTFFLVFLGCGSVRLMNLEWIEYSHTPHLAFGLILVLFISLLATTSGAHFNPAVSLAFLLQKSIDLKTFKLYIMAQFIGALCACYALFYIFPGTFEFGATIPQIPTTTAFALEMLMTCILVSVIFFVALVLKANAFYSSLVIGGTVALCSYFGGPLTGASMNPARTFAPNLFQGSSQITWLYVLAPILSAVLTSLFFSRFILRQKDV
ncbi:MAG: aquaporin [Bdellovibrionales bacterium]|nr:aquaporin [Bdellovibrionales bacterium]NQZ19222.1 aquaporin [Bdellovibrionales bacterium]